jgi:hypothetical protein
MKNKRGRIVSKKKHFSEKKSKKLKGFKPFTKSNNPTRRAGRPTPERRGNPRSRYTERLND